MDWNSLIFTPGYEYPFLAKLMPVWHIAVFIIGSCVGSFLNVCIYRMPNDIPVSIPASHCPKCQNKLAWHDNIPLLSWVVLGGKCRQCKAPISIRYFIVELITGLLFLAIWGKIILNQQPIVSVIPHFTIGMLIITTTFIDIEHRIIPNKTTYPAIIVGLISAVIFPEILGFSTHWGSFLYAFCSFIAAVSIFAAFSILGENILKKEALGWGDVKYIAAIGACLGARHCFITIFVGSVLGALCGIILIAFKKGKLKSSLPFGPYLAMGTLISMLFSDKLINLYLYLINIVNNAR